MHWTDLITLSQAHRLIEELGLRPLLDQHASSAPNEHDRAVAWTLHIELQTRITTLCCIFWTGMKPIYVAELARVPTSARKSRNSGEFPYDKFRNSGEFRYEGSVMPQTLSQ